jgi:3-deoxy-D-manno-octulosonic-acid transferase
LGERLDQVGQILIVDEIGKLGALYTWTAQVHGMGVVGGSFGSGRGGQNMLEPSDAGCCTVVGWDTRNFPDAMALLRDEGGVIEVTAANCQAELTTLALAAPRRAEIGRHGQRAWARGRGAVQRSAVLVQQWANGNACSVKSCTGTTAGAQERIL